MSIYDELAFKVFGLKKAYATKKWLTNARKKNARYEMEFELVDPVVKHTVLPLTKRDLSIVPCGKIEKPLVVRDTLRLARAARLGGVKVLREIIKLADRVPQRHKGAYWLHIGKGLEKVPVFHIYESQTTSEEVLLNIGEHGFFCSFSENKSEWFHPFSFDKEFFLSCVHRFDVAGGQDTLSAEDQQKFRSIVENCNHPKTFPFLRNVLRVLRFAHGEFPLPQGGRWGRKNAPSPNADLKSIDVSGSYRPMVPYHVRRIESLVQDAETYLLDEVAIVDAIEADDAHNGVRRQRHGGTARHSVRPHWRYIKRTGRWIQVRGHVRGQVDKLPITRISPCQHRGEPEGQVGFKRAA